MRPVRFAFALVLTGALAHLAAQPRKLETTTFAVIGDGLAAGQADFGLTDFSQRANFGALMARQMGTIFPQPLIQGPGLHDVLGQAAQSLRPPFFGTGAVRVLARATPASDPGPPLFVFNLSVPNARVRDAVTRRPAHPVVWPNDRQQTAINLLLGFPGLLFDTDVPLWTQAEYADAMNPSLAVVQLGYYDVSEAAVRKSAAAPVADFARDYASIVRRLRARFAEVLVMTVPDPFDTAFFSTPAAAARLTSVDTAAVAGLGVRETDWIAREGLLLLGNRLMTGDRTPLPAEHVVPESVAASVRATIAAYNTAIRDVAREQGAVVYDLHALWRRVRADGLTVGGARLTADYMGGFYSLDGLHPGHTGHAVIANELLALLNQTYGTRFAQVDLVAVRRTDPAGRHARP